MQGDPVPHVTTRFNSDTFLDVRVEESSTIPTVTITQRNGSVKLSEFQLSAILEQVKAAIKVPK